LELKKQSNLSYLVIDIYICYDVDQYIERIEYKIAKKSENNGERDRVE